MGEANLAAVEARVTALETLASRQANLLTEQQGVIADLNTAVRNTRDPRVDHLIGAFSDVAQDPFNSAPWDRARNIIKELQTVPPKPAPRGETSGKVADGPDESDEGEW